MKRIRAKRPSASLVISIVALVMATTGTAVATHLAVFSTDIVDGTIQGRDIGLDQVGKADLATASFGSLEAYDNALGSVDIRNDNLTGDDINEATLGSAGRVDSAGNLQTGGRNATTRRVDPGVYCIAVPGVTTTTLAQNRPIMLTADAHLGPTSAFFNVQGFVEWDPVPDSCAANEYEVQTYRQLSDGDVQSFDQDFAFTVL